MTSSTWVPQETVLAPLIFSLHTSFTTLNYVIYRSSRKILPSSDGTVQVSEVVTSCKYLGLQVDNKLDWSVNCDFLYRKVQSRLYFLRRLASFNVCKKMLQIFFNQSVVASALLFGKECFFLGGGVKHRGLQRLNKLIKKASSVTGTEQATVADTRALHKLLSSTTAVTRYVSC